jgi:predicted RNase H-like HicB family nuclease
MRELKLSVVLYPGEDGYIIAKCPVLPSCVSQGKTREEALANIREVILGCIEVRKEMGWPITKEVTEASEL